MITLGVNKFSSMAEYLREIGEHINELPVRKYHKVDKHSANGDRKSQRRTIEIILLQYISRAIDKRNKIHSFKIHDSLIGGFQRP